MRTWGLGYVGPTWVVEWWDADNLIQAPLVALWLLIPIHWWWCILGQEMIQHDYDESDHDCMRVVLNRQSQCVSWWYIIVVMFNNKSNCFICHANLTLIQIKFIKKIAIFVLIPLSSLTCEFLSFVSVSTTGRWEIWIWNVWKVWLNNFEKCEISLDCLPQIFANWNRRKYQIPERKGMDANWISQFRAGEIIIRDETETWCTGNACWRFKLNFLLFCQNF